MSKLAGALVVSVVWIAACAQIPEQPWHHGSGGYSGSGGFSGAGGAVPNDRCHYPIQPAGLEPLAGCPGVFQQGPYIGYAYTMRDEWDGGNSKVCPDCSDLGCSPALVSLCATGVAGKAVAPYYSTYWGAGFGWNIAQPVTAPNCYGDTAGNTDLTGKTLFATFDNAPPVLRIVLENGSYPTDASSPCVDIGGKTNIAIPISDFVQCVPGGSSQSPITAAQMSSVRGIQFIIPANATADIPFDFCATHLSIQ